MKQIVTSPSTRTSPQEEREISEAPPKSGAGGPLFKAMRNLAKGAASTARLMIGVPDYEAYVRHRAQMHPGEPVMSYEAFFRERQESRYGVNGGKISRCC